MGRGAQASRWGPFLVVLVFLGVACGAGTTNGTPGAASSPVVSARPVAEQVYLEVLQKNWSPYVDAYTKPPCSKWDAAGLPVELAACRQGTVDLAAVTQKFLSDLAQVSVPERFTAQDGSLKDALRAELAAATAALKAIDDKDGPKFDQQAQAIADAYNTAKGAYQQLIRP